MMEHFRNMISKA